MKIANELNVTKGAVLEVSGTIDAKGAVSLTINSTAITTFTAVRIRIL